MFFVELISLIFSVVYAVFLSIILFGILKRKLIPETMMNSENKGISVILPFKDEEKNLPELLNSLVKQDHPLIEFIFVNDHSQDDSVKCIENHHWNGFQRRIIHLSSEEYGKKSAIEKGISLAEYDYVLTTDADCIQSKEWISAHIRLLNNPNEVVAGSVEIRNGKGFWNKFQQIEMMAIQGISLGMGNLRNPISMSGANLSYEKEIFKSLNPYSSNKTVSSGDDIYFLQSLKKKNIPIEFSDDEIIRVKTNSLSIAGYFQQRIRWMKKGSSFKDFTTVMVGILIFFSSLQFIFITGYQLITLECSHLFLISGGLKILVDFLLLFLVAYRWKRTSKMIWFLPVFLTGIFIHAMLPVFGWMMSVDWKGRKI